MAVYKRFTREKSPRPGGKKLGQSEIQSRWEQRIIEAEAVKDQWKKEFGAEALEAAYYGHQRPDNWNDVDWFTLNLIFSSAKILRRNITPKDLKLRMKLSRSFLSDLNMIQALEGTIRLRSAVMQYFIDQLTLSDEGRHSYLNSLWQFGCLKIGYSAELEDNPNAGGVVVDKGGAVVYDDEGSPILQEKKQVKTEEYFIDQIDPDCLLVDRYCSNNLDKTGRWVAHKIFKSVEELQDDPHYPKSKTKNLEASALEEAERAKLRQEMEHYKSRWQWDAGTMLPENEIVVLYEIYDLWHGQMLTLARGADDILRGPEPTPPGVDLHPFVFLRFNLRRDSFYPIPVIYNWWGPQHEYNLTRNQMTLHRKRFNRKYLYDSNKIDPDEIEKLIIGDDGTFAKANQGGAVEPIKDAPLDSAVYFDTKQYREEFMELSGVGQIQRAMVGAESATEAEIVERRARESEVDEHETMMSFLSEACKKLHNCMEANLTQEGAVELVGPAGAEWITFGPENFDAIAGEILFTVEAEESSRMTLQVERAQMLQLIDILGKNPFLAADPVLLRALFEKFPAFADNELLIAHVSQMMQRMMQVQAQEAQRKQQSKQVTSRSTGGEAGRSRKVATGG